VGVGGFVDEVVEIGYAAGAGHACWRLKMELNY
jgi:hypothetical protein